ncbi:MAG: FHA domain-containing protein [Gemmataceae bacterium]
MADPQSGGLDDLSQPAPPSCEEMPERRIGPYIVHGNYDRASVTLDGQVVVAFNGIRQSSVSREVENPSAYLRAYHWAFGKVNHLILVGINDEINERRWESVGGLLRIGRLGTLEVVLDEISVSRIHAEIKFSRQGWMVKDLGSTNGTRLNGLRLGTAQLPLQTGDMIQLGHSVLRVESLSMQEAPDNSTGLPVSLRKLRLCVSACCRSLWPNIPPLVADQLCIAESYADGRVGEDALEEARNCFNMLHIPSDNIGHAAFLPRNELAQLFQFVWSKKIGDAMHFGLHGIRWCMEYFQLLDEVETPSSVWTDPVWLAWNGGFIRLLAKSIYDNRSFSDLPILGDALEEAGCTQSAILKHCRQSGTHYPGCWVIDLLLGKS